jgi:hypothetical protein
LPALRQIDRQRQSHWTSAHNDDRVLGQVRTRPILVGVATIAELGFSQRHAASTL